MGFGRRREIRILLVVIKLFFFFSSRRRHTRSYGDWSSDVCSSDLPRFLNLIASQSIETWVDGKCSMLCATFMDGKARMQPPLGLPVTLNAPNPHRLPRSEERRVGKECRTRWMPDLLCING